MKRHQQILAVFLFSVLSGHAQDDQLEFKIDFQNDQAWRAQVQPRTPKSWTISDGVLTAADVGVDSAKSFHEVNGDGQVAGGDQSQYGKVAIYRRQLDSDDWITVGSDVPIGNTNAAAPAHQAYFGAIRYNGEITGIQGIFVQDY